MIESIKRGAKMSKVEESVKILRKIAEEGREAGRHIKILKSRPDEKIDK